MHIKLPPPFIRLLKQRNAHCIHSQLMKSCKDVLFISDLGIGVYNLTFFRCFRQTEQQVDSLQQLSLDQWPPSRQHRPWLAAARHHGAPHLRRLPRARRAGLRVQAGRQQGRGEEGQRLQHQLQKVRKVIYLLILTIVLVPCTHAMLQVNKNHVGSFLFCCLSTKNVDEFM